LKSRFGFGNKLKGEEEEDKSAMDLSPMEKTPLEKDLLDEKSPKPSLAVTSKKATKKM
jgi:hypothetical protein